MNENVQFPADAKVGDKIRVELGLCGVDSGTLMVLDPCYIERFFNYERDVIDHSDERYSDGSPSRHSFVTNKLPDGREIPLGIVFSTGWGDGAYPLTATFQCFGKNHWRIVKVEVNCGEEDPEEG